MCVVRNVFVFIFRFFAPSKKKTQNVTFEIKQNGKWANKQQKNTLCQIEINGSLFKNSFQNNLIIRTFK